MLILTLTDEKNGRAWHVYEACQAHRSGMYHVRYFEKYGENWRQIFEEWWDAATVEARIGWNPEDL